jgi:hypothetical protein
MAILLPTFTSRVTFASTRSSIRALSLEIRFVVSRPITEFADTTSSSNTFCGGSSARGDSSAGRSTVAAALLSAVAAGEFGADAGDCDCVLGHGRSSAGGFVRAVVPVDFVLAVLAVLAVLEVLAVFDVVEGRAASACRDVDGVDPRVPTPVFAFSGATTASVSWTGLFSDPAPVSEDAGTDEATVAAGADPAFWRDAK